MMGGEGGSSQHDAVQHREVVSFVKIETALTGVFESQRKFLHSQGQQDLPDVTIDRAGFAMLSPDKQLQIEKNVGLLQKLIGHQGAHARNTILQTDHELRRLLDWAQDVARTGHARLSEISIEHDALLLDAKTPNELQERITFSDRFEDVTWDTYEQEVRSAAYRVLRMEPQDDWAQAAAAVLRTNPDNLGRLIESLGFVPSELFASSTVESLTPQEFARAEHMLRKIEQSHPDLADQARTERTKLTSALFTSGLAKKFRTTGKKTRHVTLDSNGVQVHFDGRRPGKAKNVLDRPFVAHIPHGLVSEELKAELETHWLANEAEGLELGLRRAEENFDTEDVHAKREHQLAAFADTFELSKATPEETAIAVHEEILSFPDRLAKRVVDKGEVIPDALIDGLLEQHRERGAFALTAFAEGIAKAITGERVADKQFFFDHGMRDAQQQSYNARAKIISDPRYYNALKTARKLIASDICSNPDAQFLLFAGQYKKSGQGRQHSFIESVHEGKVAKVLVDEKKDLRPDQGERIPTLERSAYIEVEESLRAFDHFISQIERMQKLLKYKNKNWERRLVDLAEESMVFVLTNQSDKYYELLDDYAALMTPVDEAAAERFLKGLDGVRTDYADFLYSSATTPGLEGFKDMYRPEVRTTEVSYGEEYLALAKKMCPDWGYDEELCLHAQDIRVVAMDHKIEHPSETIPVDVEEAVLDKLRVNRDRPLINVVGGCRMVGDMEKPEDHPLNRMSAAVLRVAHEAKANVAVPGTQSGIGVFFGKQNVTYSSQTEHLPFRDRAHLFSISPGGNTVYPDNPWMDQTDSSERYAVAPVDTAVTPITAMFGEKGEDRINGYDLHIAYMESLFARISQDKPRVLVAGNGGVYSILEINESIKHGFDIVLIADSGRFAEAAAVALDNLDRLPDTTDPEFDEHMFHLLEGALGDEVFTDHMAKDFGPSITPEGDKQTNYEVHRKHFREFVRLARENRDKIHETTLDDLESKLNTFM